MLSSDLIGLGLADEDSEAKKRRHNPQQRKREKRKEDVGSEKKKRKKKPTLSSLQCRSCGLCASCQLDAESGSANCSASCSSQCMAQTLCNQAAQNPKIAFLSNYLAQQGYVQDGDPVALELASRGSAVQFALKHAQDPNQQAFLNITLPEGASPVFFCVTISSSGDVQGLDVVDAPPPDKKKKKRNNNRKPTPPDEFAVVSVSSKGGLITLNGKSTKRAVTAAALTVSDCWNCNRICQNSHRVGCAVWKAFDADIDENPPVWLAGNIAFVPLAIVIGKAAVVTWIVSQILNIGDVHPFGLLQNRICDETWCKDTCAKNCREHSGNTCCRTIQGCSHIDGAECIMGECQCLAPLVECNQRCALPDCHGTCCGPEQVCGTNGCLDVLPEAFHGTWSGMVPRTSNPGTYEVTVQLWIGTVGNGRGRKDYLECWDAYTLTSISVDKQQITIRETTQTVSSSCEQDDETVTYRIISPNSISYSRRAADGSGTSNATLSRVS